MPLLESIYVVCLTAGAGSIVFEIFYIRFLHRSLDASLVREQSLQGILSASLKRCDELAEIGSCYRLMAERHSSLREENPAFTEQSSRP